MSNIIKIFSFTRKFWKWYVFMGAFVIFSSLLSLAVPILMKQIVDLIMKQVTGGGAQIQKIITLLLLVFAVDITTTTIVSFSTWIGDILAARLQTYMTQDFYKHLVSLDIGFYDNEITGRIVNKMYRGIESITDFIKNATNTFLPFVFTAIVTIILLAYYSPVIALLLAVLFPTYILISHGSTLSWNKFEEEKNRIHDLSQGRVFESISGIRVVKAFAAELTELAGYISARTHIEKLTVIQTKKWHLYDFFRRFALNIILFAIFSYIVYWTFHTKYTIGEMTLLIQLVQQARFPLFAMSFILSQIQQANAGSKDFFSILEKNPGIIDKPGVAPLSITYSKSSKPFIEFRNVSFQYERKKEILKNISFSIRSGQKLALVGESGQGKSTIVNLLLRFYEPYSGEIYVNGQEISEVTMASLRQAIAVVFQESLLFSGTIIENIRYAKPRAALDEVIAAAKAANAHEFIERLPQKYDSLIGERGVKLSGGQRQRIAIARAMLKDAPVIILDEATSSLDSRSEIEVQKGLDKLLAHRTSLIIAHRLSTIADADIVLVLARNTIVQCGKPQELLRDHNGLYAKMVELQQKLLTASPEERDDALKKYDLVG